MSSTPMHRPEHTPDNDPTDELTGATVVDLAAARGRYATPDEDTDPDTSPDTDPDSDPDTEEDSDPGTSGDDEEDSDPDDDPDTDHESLLIERGTPGAPVDPDDEIPVRLLGRNGQPVTPIVPEWARSRSSLYLSARWALKYGGYVLTYQVTRSPKYAAKMAFYAPIGALETTGRLLRWASAEEGNWSLRQAAADRGDADTWLKLDRQRQRQAVWRWWVTVPTLLAALAGILVLALGPVPLLWRIAAVLIGAPILARAGVPADARITDRVMQGTTYRKLTAELVRRGLLSLGLAGINTAVAKDPNAISFPTEIHRDGPGHLALIDLPYGVEASQVIARRGKLASALRLPMDQVWPEPDRSHPGRLALWVGHEPASAMRQPDWPLLKDGKVDVFTPFEFATDPRLRPVCAELMARNWLFGGQPGSGKTFALRLLILAAALDVRCEIRGYELKGVGDFKALAPVMTEYGNGFDDATIEACAAFFDWLFTECERRSKRIDFYAAKGMCPENKVTPELASLKGSGLHPLVCFVDEIQNLFLHKTFGKQAGEITEKVIKLGRALGVILIIGTQIPDKDSLPTGITRNVNTRFCLSVADQTANDMIQGTSMYKNGYRATVFEPGIDAGWGIAVGLGKPAAYRSYYVDSPAAARIVERAIRLRTKAGTMPTAPTERDTTPGYDLLADLLTVWPADQDRAWNETLLEHLGELRPEVYGGWTGDQLTAALKPHKVDVRQVGRRVDGKTINRRGPNRADVMAAVTKRHQSKAGV
jgi:S-DNA-T family DNA segregation ATPase FtsK/SpoIIIE